MILVNVKEIKGELGYYNLGDWWLSVFTQEERDHIVATYRPMSIGINNDSTRQNFLTEGEIDYVSGSAAELLRYLAEWFNNSRDREIAKKIITKSIDLSIFSKNILDLHFALAEKMKIYYRERNNDPKALDMAIKAAKDQKSLASQVVKVFSKEHPEETIFQRIPRRNAAFTRGLYPIKNYIREKG